MLCTWISEKEVFPTLGKITQECKRAMFIGLWDSELLVDFIDHDANWHKGCGLYSLAGEFLDQSPIILVCTSITHYEHISFGSWLEQTRCKDIFFSSSEKYWIE